MQTHEIRKRFTDHFVRNGHIEVPSASLVLNDPNQLFVIAGMVPFVPYFLGQQTPPFDRATSIQKCVRTLDIEEVGITTRHNTFFQMAGNFSFGDYFKRDAIRFAWSLLTGPVDEGGFGIDPDRLWSTVYLDDDEARDLWLEVGQVPEHIQRRGMKDNYWSMGIPGPCGPCSEIFYDRGPEYGAPGGPEADEDRYIEIWNLVFMQNERGRGTGKEQFEILGELPKKNIDTGMGIERVAFLLQGVDNVYETDLLRPVIDRAQELSGQRYGRGPDGADNAEHDRLFRVIADHTRTAVMLIEDGVNPGNDGRGYVLRRLLRRVVRSARLLGAQSETMGAFVDTVIATMSPSYPSLADDADRIRTVATQEEAAFLKTLEQGTTLFGNAVGSTKAAGSAVLSGDDAFTLHDTYGFPIDLTLEMASEAGLSVDEDGFRALMAEQRQRAKDDANARKSALADLSVFREFVDRGPTEFTGFDELVSEARVLGLIREGRRVPVAGPGADVEVILDRSPLYAEAGGQLADIGTITTAAGAQIVVTDVQRVAKTVWRHQGTVASGEVTEGDTVTVAVDPAHRHGSTQGHSGTHLVHAALRQVLGPNAVQAGSLNRPGYLRFDFRWQGGLSDAQRGEIETVTNAAVQADYDVNTEVTDLESAKKRGAMALFGENYGERVRLVEIGGPFSLELCGGTHVASSGLIGPVTLLGESSVGSGVRRVEAYVGLDAVNYLGRERALVSALSSSLKVPSDELPTRVESIVTRLKDAEKELERLRAQAALSALSDLAASPDRVGAVRLIADRAPAGVSGSELRGLVTQLKGRVGADPAVIALFAEDGAKVPFVIAANDAAQDLGVRAGDLVKAAAPAVGGRGGGKPDLAQGAGSEAAGIDTALAAVRSAVESAVGA